MHRICDTKWCQNVAKYEGYIQSSPGIFCWVCSRVGFKPVEHLMPICEHVEHGLIYCDKEAKFGTWSETPNFCKDHRPVGLKNKSRKKHPNYCRHKNCRSEVINTEIGEYSFCENHLPDESDDSDVKSVTHISSESEPEIQKSEPEIQKSEPESEPEMQKSEPVRRKRRRIVIESDEE